MLLTEKYRPKTVNDLVFIDEYYETKFKEWIEKKSIDTHLLFYGPPGTGKSSSINVLINELGITDCVRYNMSDKTSIDDMRKVIDFASSSPLNSDFKLIILEEFERASPQAQDSLKYVLEQYSGWCRFIFTTNNVAKISPAILSRCQRFEFNTLKFQDFVTRIVNILTEEKIEFPNLDDIVVYVNTYYPDLRACINAIDQNTLNGVLQPLNKNDSYAFDKFKEVAMMIPCLNVMNMKKYLAQNIANEEYEALYQYLYNNVDVWYNQPNVWDIIFLTIGKYLYQHHFVAYPDINFMACVIEIYKRAFTYSKI